MRNLHEGASKGQADRRQAAGKGHAYSRHQGGSKPNELTSFWIPGMSTPLNTGNRLVWLGPGLFSGNGLLCLGAYRFGVVRYIRVMLCRLVCSIPSAHKYEKRGEGVRQCVADMRRPLGRPLFPLLPCSSQQLPEIQVAVYLLVLPGKKELGLCYLPPCLPAWYLSPVWCTIIAIDRK